LHLQAICSDIYSVCRSFGEIGVLQFRGFFGEIQWFVLSMIEVWNFISLVQYCIYWLSSRIGFLVLDEGWNFIGLHQGQVFGS